MSFEDLKVAELREIAESFGVDLGAAKTKAAIVTELDENGVTYETYLSLKSADPATEADLDIPAEPEPKTLKAGETIVVRMTRQNGHYEVQGLTFTREHPYAIATLDQAQAIFDTNEGFRPATPRELQDYYS